MNWRESAQPGCKINLRLKITARRADGYHELSTLFYPVDFPADELEIVSGESGLHFESPDFSDADENLVVRAAKLYAETAKIEPEWTLRLKKHIPMAAGLGGGSSDAAAVLKMLNGRYQALNTEKLAQIAARLGADIPFFLDNVPAWATGIGEKLEKFPCPAAPFEVMIVFPGFPVSTPWAYKTLDPALISAEDAGIRERFAAAFAAPASAPWQELVRNDLAPAPYTKFPLLQLIDRALHDAGAAAVQLSGSGSSLFALFTDRKQGESAAEAMRNLFGDAVQSRIFYGGKEW